ARRSHLTIWVAAPAFRTKSVSILPSVWSTGTSSRTRTDSSALTSGIPGIGLASLFPMRMKDPLGDNSVEEYSERPGPGLRGYWLRVRYRRWWLFIFAFVGWLLATTLGWVLPPKYRSETVILVEQQKIPEHYVEPNVAADLQHRLQSMSEQILSRTR